MACSYANIRRLVTEKSAPLAREFRPLDFDNTTELMYGMRQVNALNGTAGLAGGETRSRELL